MYTNSEKYIDKDEPENLSTFLKTIKYTINSYGKWSSKNDSKLSYTNSDYEILYYLKGGSKTVVNGIAYTCPPGSLFFIEPYSLVLTTNEGYDEYEFYSIHFDIEPAYLQSQLTKLLISNGPLIYKKEFCELGEIFTKLYLEKTKKDIGYISLITSGLLRIIVEIIRVQQKRNPLKIQPINYEHQQVKTVNNALHYIEKHKNSALKMTSICKYLGVSQSYFYKSFIEIMGISPSKYIIQFKVKKAKYLLQQNIYSVAEISLMLGYSSPYHFCNTFKKLTGITPKEYTNQL